MSNFFSKLSFKGLFLVSILLVLELSFVGCYAWLLSKAEEESARQQKAKEIISRADDLLNSLVAAGTNCQLYVFHRAEHPECLSKYEAAMREIPGKFAWLREHLTSNSEQLDLLEKIEANSTPALQILEKMKHVADTEPPLVTFKYAIKYKAKVQGRMETLAHDLILFLNSEKQIEIGDPGYSKLQRDRLNLLLMSGVAVNIFAAILLAFVFVKSITSRLALVVDNSERLRNRLPLLSPLKGKDEIALLDSAFHEMSNSLRGEEDLVRASEQQIRAIIDQMPIGLMIVEGEQTIEYVNPSLEKLLKYDANDVLVGTKLSDYFGTTGAHAAPLTNVSSVEGVVELVASKKDRSELVVEFSVVDVSLGDLARRLAIVIDVTEKHEIEKMRQAFVAMVSHDLRTPLTSVAGFLQLLPMGVYGAIEPSAIKQAENAESHVEQLIMLINDLLDLEKMEAGKLEMVRDNILLEDVIDDAIDSVYTLAEVLSIAIMFEGCEIGVAADRERLKQAVSKLLTCLMRLCPTGDTIDVVVKPSPEQAVNICLNTHSLSIPDDKLQHIFEPFQQLNLPTTSGSLGLGLTLSRAIASQHGGTCGANAAANGGTSLWLQIPRN